MFRPRTIALSWSLLALYLGLISSRIIAGGFRDLSPVLSVPITPAFLFQSLGVDIALLCAYVFVGSSSYYLSRFLEQMFGLVSPAQTDADAMHQAYVTSLTVVFLILTFLLVFASLYDGDSSFLPCMKVLTVTVSYLCTMSAVVYINFSLWLKV